MGVKTEIAAAGLVLCMISALALPISADQYTVEDQIADEIYLGQLENLAIAVRAEAGNQSQEGKRWVAAVVLNRVEDPRFPDTIDGVLWQENQFSVMKDGAFERACWTVDATDFEAVSAELDSRSTDALFFRTGHYHEGRTPVAKVGAHYFSK